MFLYSWYQMNYCPIYFILYCSISNNLKSLEELDLSNNSDLPSATMEVTSADFDIICRITTLRALGLSHCSLRDLPSRYCYYVRCVVWEEVLYLRPQQKTENYLKSWSRMNFWLWSDAKYIYSVILNSRKLTTKTYRKDYVYKWLEANNIKVDWKNNNFVQVN